MSSTALSTEVATPKAQLASRRGAGRRLPDPVLIAVAAITCLAAALRLVHLGSVPEDPFYDAAVRSMSTSWHNFFFGAFEPGGSVSIDKPPLDLWLQVISVKVFGWSGFALKLPQALAGTAAAPILFAAVRRPFGASAGLGAALAVAVLPVEVLTARSDTMDALMMALVALGLLAIVHAGETGRTRWLVAAGIAVGLAFNVKLLQALVPVPALALMAFMALPGTARRRLRQLAIAGAVLIAVSLSWLTITLLVPSHDRPWAIGSTNGSAWNAAFVFNGYDRIAGPATAGDAAPRAPSGGYAVATQAERDRIPIGKPAPLRLLARVGPLSGERLGYELLFALLLGVPALGSLLLRGPPAAETATQARLRRAVAAGLLSWLAIGIVLFSAMARLHPRYVEAFVPAVAAALGIGAAWAAGARWGDGSRGGEAEPEAARPGRGRGALRTAWLLCALMAMTAYGYRLLFGAIGVWDVTFVATVAAGVLALLVAYGTGTEGPLAGLLPAPAVPMARIGLAILTLAVALLIPARYAVYVVDQNASDAGHVGLMNAGQLKILSAFLRAHQGSARYEVAASGATRVGALVVADARPVLVMTTYDARPLLTVAHLQDAIAAGQVRYALIGATCKPRTPRTDAVCSAPAVWVQRHGADISRQLGLGRPGILYRLPAASAARLTRLD